MAIHPTEVYNIGGNGQPDYSYREGPQPPIETTFQDAYTRGALPRLGSEPEDMMAKGADGQLHSIEATPLQSDYTPETGVATTPAGVVAAEQLLAVRPSVGTVALHGVNVRSTRVYRSGTSAGGRHARPHIVPSHRGE